MSWSIFRKLALASAVLTAVVALVLLNAPLGLVAYGLMLGAAGIWNDYGNAYGRRSDYDERTWSYRWSIFFQNLRMQIVTKTIFSPLTLGFGPPTPDPDHGYEPGLTPFARLSSYWGIVFAIPMATLDYITQYVVYPVILPGQMPWWLASLFSFFGWFALWQSAMCIFRMASWRDKMTVHPEPAPAMMLTKAHAVPDAKVEFIRSLAWGMLPAVPIFAILIAARVPFLIIAPIIVLVLLSVWLVKTSAALTRLYRAEWAERAERRMYWEGIYAFKGQSAPIFIAENETPTKEEWQEMFEEEVENGTPPEEIEPHRAVVKFAAFRFAPNCYFDDYSKDEDRIRGDLAASLISIAPMGAMNEEGEEQVGTIGTVGFRILWTEMDIEEAKSQMFSKDIDPSLLDLCIRYFVLAPMSNIRSIGAEPTIKSCDFITRKNSSKQVIEVELVLREGQTISSMRDSIKALQSTTNFKWIRFYRREGYDASNVVHMLIAESDPEHGEKMTYVSPPAIVKSLLASANWDHYFAVAGIESDGETPRMDGALKLSTPLVQEIDFIAPEGMPTYVIKDSIERLTSASSRQYMEVNTPKRLDTSKMSAGEALQKNSIHSRKVTVLSARTDPLDRMFRFSDYKDQLITGRTPGQEKITWSPGVLSNDQMAEDSFDGNEAPMLLIAGMSGSGKTVTVHNFITQLAANNSPQDATFWLIEPKIGLQKYRNLDSVTKFVDSWFPSDEFFENIAELSEEAVRTMVEKNRTLIENPSKNGVIPEKLSDARKIARREGTTGGELHPLMMPYLFITLEECATVFADAPSKDAAALQGRILANFARICREGRSAGVLLTCTTQYPTNASIPSVIRQQMRRIGMRCQNSLSSNVVIDESGLQDIRIKGAGKIRGDNGEYRQFRGYMMEVDNGEKENAKDDVNDILAGLPSNSGAPSALIRPGSSGAKQRIIIPGMSDSVMTEFEYESWKDAEADSLEEEFKGRIGAKLEAAISSGRNTKDKWGSDEASYQALQKKYGMDI